MILRNEQKLKISDNIHWWLLIALVKTKFQYSKNPSLNSLTEYAVILRKNVSQKSDEISMVSNLVHFFVSNQYLSLKILDLQKKLTGKPVINSVFL